MTDKKTPLWILGGTGDIGGRLARLMVLLTLTAENPLEIVLVSRTSPSSATGLQSLTRNVTLDVKDEKLAEQIPSGAIIVNLTEATPTDLAAKLVKAGHVFIETSASPRYISALKRSIDPMVGPGLAILYAGAAPGLTNVMAADVAANSQGTSKLDIGVEIGVGRQRGSAATKWFLEAAGTPYPVFIDNQQRTVHSGKLLRKFAFDGGDEERLAIGYGFAEQLDIAEQFKTFSSVRQFVALDPSWLTKLLQYTLVLGLRRVLMRHASFLAWAIAKGPDLGKTGTRFLAEGRNEDGAVTKELHIVTGDQAEVTAAMLFAIVRALIDPDREHRAGIARITDFIDLEEALSALRMSMPETRMTCRPENKNSEIENG